MRAPSRPDADTHAVQYVKVASPQAPKAGQTLALPGTLQGQVQSPISARASGYLKRWTKDIGSKVQKGELLAEIETPEIDQQLSQAVAARQQAAAGLELAKSTVARWEALRKKDVVSQQELDERRSAVASATANLAAADANVQRLRQTEGFKRVVAPFAGVITRRNVDVGDLIDAGSGNGGRALFTLAQTDPLRVYINVPQAYAQLVKPGQAVVVTQSELRGQNFKGEVARTSGAIDTSHPHDAGGSRAAQSGRHPAARRLCAGRAAAGGQHGAHRAWQCADLPRRGRARGRGRRVRQGPAAAGEPWAATSARWWSCWKASRPATGWCSTRPIRWPTATR